jgi:hypothetical protein
MEQNSDSFSMGWIGGAFTKSPPPWVKGMVVFLQRRTEMDENSLLKLFRE